MWHKMIPNKLHRKPTEVLRELHLQQHPGLKVIEIVQNKKKTLPTNFLLTIKRLRELFNCKHRSYFMEKYGRLKG